MGVGLAIRPVPSWLSACSAAEYWIIYDLSPAVRYSQPLSRRRVKTEAKAQRKVRLAMIMWFCSIQSFNILKRSYLMKNYTFRLHFTLKID